MHTLYTYTNVMYIYTYTLVWYHKNLSILSIDVWLYKTTTYF